MATKRRCLLILILLILATCVDLNAAQFVPNGAQLPLNCDWLSGNRTGIECDGEIPDFSAFNPEQLAPVTRFYAKNCHFVVFAADNFQNLMNLKELTVDCDETIVLEGAFNGLKNVTSVKIGRGTGALPRRALCDMTSVKILKLDGNFIDSGANFGLLTNCSKLGKPDNCGVNIVTLSASHNMLTTISKDGFLCNLGSLVDLNLTRNAISEIESGALSSVPKLGFLNLAGNQLSYLPEDIFESSSSLFYLDLSDNRLATLPNGIFKYLSRLQMLSLAQNQFSTLDGVFDGQTSLIDLNLSNNRLVDITRCLQKMTKLTRLVLKENKINSINSDTFSNFKDLFSLNLDHNDIGDVADDAFLSSTSLMMLSMDHNRLKRVPKVFHSRFLLLLSLEHNDIDELSGSDFNATYSRLMFFRLSHNKIQTIGEDVFSHLTNLVQLLMTDNGLKYLHNDTFTDHSGISSLTLDGNRLTFDENVFYDSNGVRQMNLFKKLTRLSVLGLANNSISNFEWFWFPTVLVALNLTHNQIRRLPTSNPNVLTRLTVLDLSYNLIESLGDGQFPLGVTHLVLKGNKISYIEPDTFEDLQNLQTLQLQENSLRSLAQLKLANSDASLLLHDNPWICDCKLAWIKSSKMTTMAFYNSILMKCDVLFNHTLDEHPETIFSTKDDHFLCPFKKDSVSSVYGQSHLKTIEKCTGRVCLQQKLCPENCTCYHNIAWTIVKVVCADSDLYTIPHILPDATDVVYVSENRVSVINFAQFQNYGAVKHLYIRSSKLRNIDTGTFIYSQSLQKLYLDHNELRSLPKNVFLGLTNVTHLDLSFNLLNTVSPNTFNDLESLQVLNLQNNQMTEFQVWSLKRLPIVGLAGNPWTCNCSFVRPYHDYIKSNPDKIVNGTQLYCKPDAESSTNRVAIINITQCFESNFIVRYSESKGEENAVVEGSNVTSLVVGLLFGVLILVLVVLAVIYRYELKIVLLRTLGRRLLTQ